MKKIKSYLNPIERLGTKQYSIVFPLIANIALGILSELYTYDIAKDPNSVGMYIIFLNVFFIIYFSFRDGIKGGFITTGITICYYLYIIETRHYHGSQFTAGIQTTIMLTLIYLLLAAIIGWLKQTIDQLINREADEKKRLQTIIHQLPVGVIIAGNDGKITHINPQVDKMLGVKLPLGFKIERDTLKKIKIDETKSDPAKTLTISALVRNKPMVGQEITFERRGGKMKHLQISAAPILNTRKQTIATASIITDMTAQKELERQKDDFLSMASHELKTPITSMNMFIGLLKKQLKGEDSAKAKYYIDRIHDQANRLNELTNDLLDVSRIQTGKLRLHEEEFSLSQVVEDTIEGLKGTTDKHEIKFVNEYNKNIIGDRYRIYQIVVNLVTNAIKYSPDGKKIIIRVRKENNNVILSIQDFGIGISKEQQKKIFKKLYQVTDSDEKTFPGLGLGLYISKQIVQQHKGKIWVESKKMKGSTFFFSLPIQTIIR